MGIRVIVAAMTALPLAAGCAVAGPAVRGHHRYTMPTDSMLPGVRKGQVLETEPVAQGKYQPRRGDIVIFTGDDWDTQSERGEKYLKRVIAIGGDTIRCCSKDGKVILNGAPLSEPYVATPDHEAPFRPVTVRSGRIWVMGDNRTISYDSRGHIADPVDGTIAAASVTDVVIPRRP